MRGDLNEQLQRAQASAGDTDKSQQLILGVGIFLIISFIVCIIAGTAFFIKMVDKFVDTDTTTASQTQGNLPGAFSSGGETTNSNSFTGKLKNRSEAMEVTKNFQFGTVDGTTYHSNFSGITFTAPSDWVLSPVEDTKKTTTALLHPKDFSASSENLSQSVIISYEVMSYYGYNSIEDAMASTITLATGGMNNSMVDDNVSLSLGGRDFKGIIYKKTMGSGFEYYNEVIFAEVQGYALKIQIQANTQGELSSILSMFS